MTSILGYADRVSVAPGESIEFRVSCDGLESYEAAVVRIIQGDINPEGPGYEEEPIALDLGGPFRGRHQPIHAGSFARIDDSAVFRGLSSLGALAAVWPTAPGRGPQAIMARRDPETGLGFELYLDALPAAKARGTAKPALEAPDLQPVRRDFAFLLELTEDQIVAPGGLDSQRYRVGARVRRCWQTLRVVNNK